MYYSTNGKAPLATLEKAVVKGLAEDRGLYMPESIRPLPGIFFENIGEMDFREVACAAAYAFFGEDVDRDVLHDIVYDTLSFDCPVSTTISMPWSFSTVPRSPSRTSGHASWPGC